MPHEPSTDHISLEELAEYFTNEVSEEREEHIEEHLAECTQCTEEARQWHRFASVWDTWTARSHGAAYQQASLARALQQVQVMPALQERLRRWLTQIRTHTGAAVRVALQAGERLPQVITEGLETLLTPEPSPQLVRARGAVRTRGGRQRGSAAAETSSTPPTRGIRTRGAHLAAVPAPADSPRQGVQVQHGASGVIEVRLPPLPRGQQPPLVLLVPMKEEGEARLGALQQENGHELYIRFEGVSPGEYMVAFEPLV